MTVDNSVNIIKTSNAPEAIGAYSQGILFKDLIFTSGQAPINPKTGKVVLGDFRNQVSQVLKNIKNILESQGSNKNKILKLTVFLTDLTNFNDLNDEFCRFFKDDFPARSVVEVARLPKNAKVVIEAISCK